MGTVESITKRLKSERRDVSIQASISAHDADLLDEFVAWLNERGVQTNRSSAVRALVLDGLDAFETVRGEQTNPKAEALSNAPRP